jgi:hypothetical protein
MPSNTDLLRNSQEQYLETIRQSQNAFVEAVSAWTKNTEGISTPAVPGFESMPSAQDVLEGSFDFAEQLLQAQREFTRNLLAAAAPAVERAGKEAQSAAKNATKAATSS